MPPRDQVPSLGTEQGTVPYQVVNELFAAGLDVHRALRCLEHDLDPERCLRSVLARLDLTIATVLRAALASADTEDTAED